MYLMLSELSEEIIVILKQHRDTPAHSNVCWSETKLVGVGMYTHLYLFTHLSRIAKGYFISNPLIGLYCTSDVWHTHLVLLGPRLLL